MRFRCFVLVVLAGIVAPVALGSWRADSALLAAAKTGDPETFARALAAGADPNSTDFNGCTALFWAAAGGRADLLGQLLQLQADVNRPCEDGDTPLWTAARNGHVGAVTRLLESGAWAAVDEPEFRERVGAIAARGFARTAGVLTSAYASGNTAKPQYPDFVTQKGRTALMQAASNGQASRVEALLASGASVNAVAPDKENPVTLAARAGHRDVLEILLGRSPKPVTVLPAFRAAAGRKDLEEVLEPFVRAGDKIVQLAESGDTTATLNAASATGTVDWLDRNGHTPLYGAAARGHIETVGALLEAGADLTLAVNQDAVRAAQENGQAQVASYLTTRVELANNRLPLIKILPSVRDYETLWRLRPGWRAMMDAMDAELAPHASRPEVPIKAAADRAHASLAALRDQADRLWKPSQPVSRSYLADLAATLWAVHQAGSAAEPAVLLNSVADDLDAKLEHCRKTNTGLGGKVHLRVRTMKGASEVKNWRVFYLPKIFEDQTGGEPFPAYSSPTEFPLSPGRYVVWAKNPATGVQGERSIVRLGGGRTAEELQIPVP